MTTTYSASSLATYRQCPQKYKFSYIDHLQPDQEGIEAFMGSRIHEALEKLYKDLLLEKPMSLEGVLDEYRKKWDEKWHNAIQIVREEIGPAEYFKIGQRAITDYYKHYAPFNQSRTLGVEYPIQFSLDEEGLYPMRGFIDRLSMPSDGILWIHDYKAKGFLPTQPELDDDHQLAFYQMAVKKLWPDIKEIVLIWHYLLFDMEFHSRRTEADLSALREETISTINEIEKASAFPPKQSGLCAWCEYRAICPIFSHLYETASLLPNDYSKEEGVGLVGRFVALQAEEERIKSEIGKLKEAIVAYAQKKNIEILYDKTHKLRVRVYENIHFPGRGDPGRTELEMAIKKDGLWDEVSELSTFTLSKKILSASWPKEVTEEIKKMGVPDKTIWMKLSPR